MKREDFLLQLVDSMSISLDKLEEAIKENDFDKFQNLKAEILKIKDEISKELEK